MSVTRVKELLAVLTAPPTPLEVKDAFSLACTCRAFTDGELKLAALWKWYCMSLVDCDDVNASLELLPLWRQLLVSLQGVKRAARAVATATDRCTWLLESPSDLRCAVEALRVGRQATLSPRELFMATICGGTGADHLGLLRQKWDNEGHRSNMATCFIGEGGEDLEKQNKVSLHTRDGIIDVKLICEMRRFALKPGVPEARAVCFAMFPLSERIGCLWDGTEEIPKLFCASATSGIDMFSLDVYRFDGKLGATRRGSVTHAVDESDLRRELRAACGNTTEHPQVQQIGEESRSTTMNPWGADDHQNDELVLEDDAPTPDEITSEGSEGGYDTEVRATANAFQRFDSGRRVNLLFCLHGENHLLLSPHESDDDHESHEEEFAIVDDGEFDSTVE